jgi:hypothetical protein
MLDKLFFQYAPIHQKLHPACDEYSPIIQIAPDGFVLISSDLFSHSAHYGDVVKNLENAIANNQLLSNDEMQ